MAKKKQNVTEEIVVTEIEQPTMASGIEQDAAAPEMETPADVPAPKKKGKKTKARPNADASLTLEDLCARYIAHLEEVGKSAGTTFSYRLELTTALDELGKDTPVSTLTPTRVLEYFTSDRVMKTRTGIAKARPTFLKTQRVLRLALVWAQDAGLIEKAPLPEDAATF
jgi:hypothetical protein